MKDILVDIAGNVLQNLFFTVLQFEPNNSAAKDFYPYILTKIEGKSNHYKFFSNTNGICSQILT